MTSSPDMLAAALKMVAALGIVLALAGGVVLAARRFVPFLAAGRSGLIQVLETRLIGPRKSIALVQVPGAVLVVGVGSGAPTLLARLDAADLPADRRGGVGAVGAPGFEQVLGRLLGRDRDRAPRVSPKESAGGSAG
jgi:flagellar biogenesis protein FliO